MISQTGFRPSGRVLGQIYTIPPAFPSYLSYYSVPTGFPVGPMIYPVGAVTGSAPEVVTVPAPSAPSPSTLGWIAIGAVGLIGAGLLISAVSPKR